MVFSLRQGTRGCITGGFEFPLSLVVSDKKIKRLFLLEPNRERKRSLEFCLSIEGEDHTFANLYIQRPMPDEHLCRMGSSKYTPDELRSCSWQNCLELIPTADLTIRSLCQDIHTRELDYDSFQNATQDAAVKSIDWRISQWT